MYFSTLVCSGYINIWACIKYIHRGREGESEREYFLGSLNLITTVLSFEQKNSKTVKPRRIFQVFAAHGRLFEWTHDTGFLVGLGTPSKILTLPETSSKRSWKSMARRLDDLFPSEARCLFSRTFAVSFREGRFKKRFLFPNNFPTNWIIHETG